MPGTELGYVSKLTFNSFLFRRLVVFYFILFPTRHVAADENDEANTNLPVRMGSNVISI